MAKGKHAAALFEVIHSGQDKPKPLLSTPRWWFKRARSERSDAVEDRRGVSARVGGGAGIGRSDRASRCGDGCAD